MARYAYLALLPLVMAPPIWAASSDNHLVQIEVQTINELSLSGGNISLVIDSATAGSEPDDATSNSTTLIWTTNQNNRKLTIDGNSIVTGASLSAEANITSGGGDSEGAVSVGLFPQDLITSFGSETGAATITYRASTTADRGTSDNTYSITYTLTAQ